jgi:hypothetical protein
MKLLVTHHAPDLDAIGSVWMLKTFDNQHFADAKVGFVDPGQSITEDQIMDMGFTRADFDEVVHTDTGLGEFDHHQKDRGMLHICATSLTYEHCCKVHPELKKDKALQELVRIVTDLDHFGECFWPEANDSRYAFMLHEILDGLQSAGLHNDDSQMSFGMKCLQGVYKKLEEMENAKQVLAERGKEFQTKWGKGVGIESNNDTVVKYAQKAGYFVVIRKDPDEHHARVKGVPIDGMDLTPFVDVVLEKDQRGTWYFHPSKKMFLNGSEKMSKNKVPTSLSLEELIKIAVDTLN